MYYACQYVDKEVCGLIYMYLFLNINISISMVYQLPNNLSVAMLDSKD